MEDSSHIYDETNPPVANSNNSDVYDQNTTSPEIPDDVNDTCRSIMRSSVRENGISRQNALTSQTSQISHDSSLNERVTFNCGGVIFQTTRVTCLRKPCKRFKLADPNFLSQFYDDSRMEYFFDRDPEVFKAVLNFWRTGNLHLPLTVCGPHIKDELEFWGLQEIDIEPCCWDSYNMWMKTVESLRKLERDKMPSYMQVHETGSHRLAMRSSGSKWSRGSQVVWEFLTDPSYSRSAKVYAYISLLFVVLAIFSFCASTHKDFQLNTNRHNQAANEVTITTTTISTINIPPPTTTTTTTTSTPTSIDGTNSNTNINSNDNGGSYVSSDNSNDKNKNNNNNSEIDNDISNDNVNDNSNNSKNTKAADSTAANIKPNNSTKALDYTSYSNAQDNSEHSTATSIQTDQQHTQEPRLTTKDFITLGNVHPALFYIDIVCMVFFTIEYFLRLICAPHRCKFVYSISSIVDLLAVLPDYVEFIIFNFHPDAEQATAVVQFMPFLRLMRALRIFRLVRRVPGLWIMLYTLKASFKDLSLMLVFLLVGTLFFSSVIYFVDDPDVFKSIPHGFWWAIVTMTTVGYGDVAPTTAWGKLVGSTTAICGVLLVGFTIPALVNNFITYYRHVEFVIKKEKLLTEAWQAEGGGCEGVDSVLGSGQSVRRNGSDVETVIDHDFVYSNNNGSGGVSGNKDGDVRYRLLSTGSTIPSSFESDMAV